MKKKVLSIVFAISAFMAMGAISFADEATPASMLDSSTLQIVKDFGADIVPTVVALIAVIVPVGLTLWGIGFAVKKGINFLQKRAKQAV